MISVWIMNLTSCCEISSCYCLQRHHVTSNSNMSPSIPRSVHRNMSAPSSPVHKELSESHGNGGDIVHNQQPSLPYTDSTRIHTSMSDNAGDRYTDKRYADTKQNSERPRVDHEYSNYAYVRASAVNHPQMKDEFVDYRTASGRGAAVTSDGVYAYLCWPGHRADRSREFGGHVNSQRPIDANLYNIASNRTVSYAGSDELQSTLPVTAAATASRFLDPAPRWPTKYGSLEGAYRRQNGDVGNSNLSGSGSYVGNSPYTGSETSLPDRSYDAMPRRFASPPVHYETPPHVRAAAADTSCDSVELSPADSSAVVLRGQNCVEVSKPFEMADVYKYSSRMRRAAADGGDRIADLRSTSSPHLTTHSREPQHPDHRPAYTAPNAQYFPSRQYRKPVFDWANKIFVCLIDQHAVSYLGIPISRVVFLCCRLYLNMCSTFFKINGIIFRT